MFILGKARNFLRFFDNLKRLPFTVWQNLNIFRFFQSQNFLSRIFSKNKLTKKKKRLIFELNKILKEEWTSG